MHKILLLMAAAVFVAGCAGSDGMAKDTMGTAMETTNKKNEMGSGMMDGFDYPAVANVLRIMVQSM